MAKNIYCTYIKIIVYNKIHTFSLCRLMEQNIEVENTTGNVYFNNNSNIILLVVNPKDGSFAISHATFAASM